MPPKRKPITQPQPIPTPNAIDRSKPYLRLCVDYGTTHGSGHSQLVDSDKTSQTATIQSVELKQHHGLEIKQVCCYDKPTGKVIYGSRDVTNYLLTCQDPQAAPQTLQFVKMASIPQFRHSEHVKHVRRVLHGEEDTGYLRDFLEDHFASIFQDALAFHKRQCPSFDLEERTTYAAYIDSLPIELQLPVPVMMDDNGRADFRIAALSAGAAEVELREEPLCVAAKYMPKLTRDGWLKKGQCILVADIGGMTADFATTKLLDDSELRMQRVGQCHGNGAGSHLLNAQLIHHVLQEPDLQECLEHLEIDQHNLVQQLSEWFDDVKREIDTGGKLEFLFPVRSSHGQSGVEGRAHNKVFRFSRDMILGFYHTWIEEVKQELRKHISTKSEEAFAGAIIVGGGSRSVMFQEEIAAFLGTYSIRVLPSKACEFPCSEGGLTQHFFEKDALPIHCVWYISRTEEYCEQTHPDAKLHENLQRLSEYDSSVKVVHDRLAKIKQYSSHQGFEPRRKQRLLLEVFVKTHEDPAQRRRGRLDIPLFWSEVVHDEHAPGYTPEGQRVKGLRSYPVMFDLPKDEEFGRAGFQKHSRPGEDPYYLAHAFVDMHGDASGLVMNATIMKAKFAKKSKGLQFVHDLVWFSPASQIIWTPTSSHFVSQYTGATDVQCRFNTQDELPAGEPTREETPLAIGVSSRPSGSLDQSPTGDPLGQALPFPGPSSHISNGNDSGSAFRQPRKRTGEDSRASTKRTRNSVQHPGAVAPHSSNTNTNTNTDIIARQLQELERAMMGAPRGHRGSSIWPHPSRAPNITGPSSPTRSSTVCRSPSPGAWSRRKNRIAGSDTSMLLRAFE
jgi:hypothetical protein